MTRTGMKGGGFYDSHSRTQLSLIERNMPLIKNAVQRLPLPCDNCVFVDYGCSEGKNSIATAAFIIECIREKFPNQVITIIHNDLPANNFDQLFLNLYGRESKSYLSGTDAAKHRTFALASGASFYCQVVPSGIGYFGFSSSSVHWLSNVPPGLVADHIIQCGATTSEQTALGKIAARDWVTFLHARAAEFVPGARLLITMGSRLDPKLNEKSSQTGESFSCEIMMNLLNEILHELVEEHLISPEQFMRYTCPIYLRSEAEILAPLKPGDSSALGEAFAVEHLAVDVTPCPNYARYLANKDAEEYARELVATIRAFTEPSLLSGIFPDPDGTDGPRLQPQKKEIVDTLFGRMEQQVAADPTTYAFNPIDATILLARL